ncbi:hypothetical protein DVA67_002315 [Solirubrobacter sp. CPCC 204708]|uniref:Uncharacterized protein n=1 Tax=Solirubrobacter deserti TaxID=2282478 RepID=A0ABT4RRL7_9ACTN|nr:hypothetical protein [Solirubrobacter deserti]MBE2314794.1 hypothetical protein [Solirubrobacter deserti]MDA0141204.1 hypothetical protein [Solirubrobacter deserti]
MLAHSRCWVHRHFGRSPAIAPSVQVAKLSSADRSLLVVPAALLGGVALPCTASAAIVKDFGTREGDVAYYTQKTGFKFKRGQRTATVVNPRLVLDTPESGYVSMLISNERIKSFTVSGARATAADSGKVQQTKGYTLKLTQAGANYVNRALRKKALKRFSQFGTLDVRLIQPASSGTPVAPGCRARRAPRGLRAAVAACPAGATRPAAR